MNPILWKEMVERSRELEFSLGTTFKKIESNELDTVVLQRRSIRLKNDLAIGTSIQEKHLIELRPCPDDAIPPYPKHNIIGKKLSKNLFKGDYIRWKDLN